MHVGKEEDLTFGFHDIRNKKQTGGLCLKGDTVEFNTCTTGYALSNCLFFGIFFAVVVVLVCVCSCLLVCLLFVVEQLLLCTFAHTRTHTK